jgi:hypothetical protein
MTKSEKQGERRWRQAEYPRTGGGGNHKRQNLYVMECRRRRNSRTISNDYDGEFPKLLLDTQHIAKRPREHPQDECWKSHT